MILLLDDEVDYLFMLERILKKHNFNDYKAFHKYDEFLNAVNKDAFVVIIDHELKTGGISGLDVMERVLQINPFCKILVCSGQESLQTAVDYYENGCFFYLLKDNPMFEQLFMDKIIDAMKKTDILLQLKASANNYGC